MSRIQFKHNNEIQAMELRIESHKNQLLREQSAKIYELELKFRKQRKQRKQRKPR